MVFAKWTQLCFPSQTMAETQALESKNAAIWAFRRIGSLFYVFFFFLSDGNNNTCYIHLIRNSTLLTQ